MDFSQSDSRQKDRRRKRPRKATPAMLERVALHYLQRYASSAENLRQILLRRIQKSAAAHGTDPDEGAAAIDDLIGRYERAGLLDDAAYAEMRARSLLRRGTSRRMIQAKLAAKGVRTEDIKLALMLLEERFADSDLIAACNYARRRRIGPWRTEDRAPSRERDLAALARQGFAYDLARRVIDAPDTAELESAVAANCN
jgi:regulatory protein